MDSFVLHMLGLAAIRGKATRDDSLICYTCAMDKCNSDFKNKLAILGLNARNSVVIGSGVLDALGMRKSNDIDVMVDKATYAHLKESGRFQEEQHYGRSVLVGDNFEANTRWGVLGKDQTLSDLARQSITIDDVRYITLDFLLAVKKSWLQDDDVRQKDIDDVKLIEEYLARQKTTLKPDANFTEVVRSMANTPPISNEEIVQRSKERRD